MDNNLINELYSKLDAQDKIINNQALEIARLKEDFAVLKTLQMNTNNILNELEKYYKEQLEFITELPAYTKDIAREHKVMELCYEDTLDKIQELKEKYK